MLRRSTTEVTLKQHKNDKYLLYTVRGNAVRPLRFDLINLDGKKVRSVDLLVGNEFAIPIRNLDSGEYLYALNSVEGLLKTGVVTL